MGIWAPRDWSEPTTVHDTDLDAELGAPFAALIALLGAWSNWTPALTSSGTNPTGVRTNVGRRSALSAAVGSSGDTIARKTASFNWKIDLTTVTSAGTGNYQISLPAPAVTTNAPFFVGSGRIKCAGTLYRVDYELDAGGTWLNIYRTDTLAQVTATAPGAWAAGDFIYGSVPALEVA